MKAIICDLQTMQYQDAHQLQLYCLNWRLADNNRPDIFLVVEHPAVFTLGRRGLRNSLLKDEIFLQKRGISVAHVERGGDITYHGPGQLVLYPILSLKHARFSVKEYIALLEELMISLTADFGIRVGRDVRNRGVWVGNNKIGSIGISVHHGVAFHGMALNVNIDLEPFQWVNPCGLTGVGMTSLARETGAFVDFAAVKRGLFHYIGVVFNCETVKITQEKLRKKIHGMQNSESNIYA